MGLGISSQSPVIEGFGILAMASVGPILIVLAFGLIIQAKQKSISVTDYFENGEENGVMGEPVQEPIEQRKSAS